MKQSAYNVWIERSSGAYVYNGISGSLLKIDAGNHAALRAYLDRGSMDCPPSLLEQLVRGRMLIADDVDELEALRQRRNASQSDTRHLGLTLITSLGCNFDCPYCFEAKFPSVMNNPVQAAVLRLVDDQIPKIDQLTVTWFGGEPLVGKRVINRLSKAFIERCDQAQIGYDASIVTNGYLLTEDACQELRDAKVASAQVTIDGPPEVHDRMRPLVNGLGTFWQIVKNLHHAVKYMSVNVRVNIDTKNVGETEKLLQILVAEGLAGKLGVNLGHLVGGTDSHAGPSASYKPACLTNAEFAHAEVEFNRIADRYGFGTAGLPAPTGAPCTAVRANELVVGSKGELYKCWESVGDAREVIGHIDDYENLNSRTGKWLKYNPFEIDECRSCIALPVCMGGCAQHAMDKIQYHNRCGTFRHTFREQVHDFVEHAERVGIDGVVTTNQLARRMETR